MIIVEKLTKIFKSKREGQCVALDNVSFTLADRGMVFVTGKSGSGKTTLLSLIGGLDGATSGDICVNGKFLSEFSASDYVKYRNATIGFVFQDFHLLNELTVKENVKASLDLQGVTDEQAVLKTLEQVGLKGYENRFPKELSGGEKQRVAIARALVKNPTLILADEPTGNLDSRTTKQVLDLLKELSRHRLVVVVSHNLGDARRYADRIIELSQGKIVRDLVRNPDFSEEIKIENGKLFLPSYKKIGKSDGEIINRALSGGEIKQLVQVNNAFIINKDKNHSDLIMRPMRFASAGKMKPRDTLDLAVKFAKKDLFRLVIYAVIVVCLIVVLGLCELIVDFDASEIISDELSQNGQMSVALRKNALSDDTTTQVNSMCLFSISDDEIQAFYDDGYEGNVFKLVNLVIPSPSTSISDEHFVSTFTYNNVFYTTTSGTLITTEEYMQSVFGNIEYVIQADVIEAGGVYITDYTADAILYGNPRYFKTYKSILGVYKNSNNNGYGYINGIIKTNYREKYAEIIDIDRSQELTADQIKKITSSELYRSYYDDVMINLSVAYTTNPNFVEDMISLGAKQFCPVGNSVFSYDDKDYECRSGYFERALAKSEYVLSDGEIVMNYGKYNSIFGTKYDENNFSNFVPHEVTFKHSYYNDINSVKVDYTFTAKIVSLCKDGSIYLSDDLFNQALKNETFTSALYFDNTDKAGTLINAVNELGYENTSIIAATVATMTKAVSVFKDFFVIIFVGLCVCAVFVIANYGMKLIKERKHELGVLKALGARDSDLSVIVGLQAILLTAIIIVGYVFGSLVFIGLANDVLINSLVELAPQRMVIDVQLLYCKAKHFLLNGLLVAAIVVSSFVTPLLKLRRLKPTNIIKAHE